MSYFCMELDQMQWIYIQHCGYWWPGALTHWGRVAHICVDNQTIIVSDNGLSPGRRQAIVWTNVAILLIEPLGTNFSEILITFSVKKMHLKMLSGNWRPFCLGLNELTPWHQHLYAHPCFFCSSWVKHNAIHRTEKTFLRTEINMTKMTIWGWRNLNMISKMAVTLATGWYFGHWPKHQILREV